MAKVERASPINSSFDSIIASPNFLNASLETSKFLTPNVKNFRRSFSPFPLNSNKTPNLSPIIKPKTPLSSSSFLKRRDLTNRGKKVQEKTHKTKHSRVNDVNPVMEMTMSVNAVLKDLGLVEYFNIFEKEEIYLDVFFTISDDDLKSIGIANKEHRQKLLDFIKTFKTPQKPISIPFKNVFYRH